MEISQLIDQHPGICSDSEYEDDQSFLMHGVNDTQWRGIVPLLLGYEEKPQLLNAGVGAHERMVPLYLIDRLHQHLEHIDGRILYAVPEQELLGVGEPFHGRYQPQNEPVVRFDRRARLPGPIRHGVRQDIRRDGQSPTPCRATRGLRPLDPLK